MTRRTRWLTTYHGYFQIVLSQVTVTVCLLPSKRSCQVYQQHHGTSRKGQFLHASEIPVQYRHVEDLQPLITSRRSSRPVLLSHIPVHRSRKKAVRTDEGNLTALMTCSSFWKAAIFHDVIKAAAVWKPVGNSFDLWHIQEFGTRNLGESCFCWAPQRLANVADGVTQFEGQTVKNSRFFVDFSLCYWEFSQQKPSGFCWFNGWEGWDIFVENPIADLADLVCLVWAGDIVSSHSISRDIFQMLSIPPKTPMITQRSTFFVFSLKRLLYFPGTKKKGHRLLEIRHRLLLLLGRKGWGVEKFSEQSQWRVIASLLKEVLSSICRKPYAIGEAMWIWSQGFSCIFRS